MQRFIYICTPAPVHPRNPLPQDALPASSLITSSKGSQSPCFMARAGPPLAGSGRNISPTRPCREGDVLPQGAQVLLQRDTGMHGPIGRICGHDPGEVATRTSPLGV
ncbi:hypothetical protein DR999_PMT21513 [Platysternon megacephalum]|uniref:Uncharacterized protein n=1 Tax=Platysternon megacephalum TaxID=55544 RepID=A0A4D9DIH6_9SAUR|nr:hypothetical protein DR999_PMT21513 [Platysternon megacephalum]